MVFQSLSWYKGWMSEKKMVLVVEDDEDIAYVLKTVLEDAGYSVFSLTDSTSVFEVIKTISPHLILLDIWMPGIDGLSITRQLKQRGSSFRVPIILLSATTDGKEQARLSGADDFIAKPFDMDNLLLKVQTYVPVSVTSH